MRKFEAEYGTTNAAVRQIQLKSLELIIRREKLRKNLREFGTEARKKGELLT